MPDSHPPFDDRGSPNGLIVAAGLLLFCGLLWFGTEVPSYSGWDEYGYAQKYHVTIDLVHVAPKPKDCDWVQMPIGNKACHYERKVLIKVTQHTVMGQDLDEDMTEEEYTKAATQRGRYDEPLPPRLTAIQISWVKVEGH
jgi:hypothetical protein